MRHSIVFGLACVLIVSIAAAQQPGGFGGARGGGRGFGGGGMGGPLQIAQMEKVQEELKIKTGQKRRIDELAEEMRTEMQGMFNFQEFQGLGDEQRRQKMEELREKGQELQNTANAKLKDILDEEQMARLQQLRLQQTGIRALAEEGVAEELGLSPAQKAKVTKITTEAMQSFTQGFAGFGQGGKNPQQMTDEERRKMFEDMRKRGEEMRKRGEDMTKELESVLTEDQTAKWAEMQGEKFEFPAFAGFGGAGGPGGRGPGGAGGAGGTGGFPGAQPAAEKPAAEEPAAEEPAPTKGKKKPAKKGSTKSSKSSKKSN